MHGEFNNPTVVIFVLFQVMFTVFTSHALWVSRTREQSAFNASFDVIAKWITVIVTLLILSQFWPTAEGVVFARLICSFAFSIFLMNWLSRQIKFSFAEIDLAETKKGMRYGIPMALSEISGVLLGLVDRLMIKHLLNDFSAVGIYSIGFGLASYFDQIISNAFSQAITPAVNRLYITKGEAAVLLFKRNILNILVYISCGFICFIVIAGRDLLLTLAGADKESAAEVFVIAAIFFSIMPVLKVASTGLLLGKRSDIHLIVILSAAMLNIGLNLFAIPAWGTIGALTSTCFSLAAMNISLYTLCPKAMRCLPDLSAMSRAATAACVSYFIITGTGILAAQSHWARVLMTFTLVSLLYGGAIFATDSNLRQTLQSLVNKKQ
jgi:O-antigen/teichoic acid export membrane protein